MNEKDQLGSYQLREVDGTSDKLIQAFDDTVLSHKNYFAEFKLEKENLWQKCWLISPARKLTRKYQYGTVG